MAEYTNPVATRLHFVVEIDIIKALYTIYNVKWKKMKFTPLKNLDSISSEAMADQKKKNRNKNDFAFF